MGKTIILSLGGSIIVPQEIDVAFLRKFRQEILKFVKKGNRAVIVCGGGSTNKNYNAAAKSIANPFPIDIDWLGISATKLNAELLRAVFGKLAYETVVSNPTEKIKTGKRIIIASGWKPGWSTDYDAALLAVNFRTKTVVNLTNIDHVYDRDPGKYPKARKFSYLSWKQYLSIVGEKWSPRMHSPFDPMASKLCMRKNISVHIAKGTIENIRKILAGKEVKGTVISN